MKRKIGLFITIILTIVLCAGCGKQIKIKTEEELLADLLANSSFHMLEGSEVTELSIIKRLTNQDDKTDKVYVSIDIDHEVASATRAYIMYYTCYNEGWLLDNIEEYYGDEVQWTNIPKNPPTNEEIMEELIAYSNSQIDASYARQEISDGISRTYFFEEGKYSTKIYSGSMQSESAYTCCVETERMFDYVTVHEEQFLYFIFNESTYEWDLNKEEILWADADYYLDGSWQYPRYGATIQFSETECQDGAYGGYSVFDVCFEIEDEMVSIFSEVTLEHPTTNSINVGQCRVWDSEQLALLYLEIEAAPDMILCKEQNEGYLQYTDELDKIILDSEKEQEPSKMEVTGIVDMSVDEESEPYREIAENVIKSIYIDQDISYAKEFVWNPEDDETHAKIEKSISEIENYVQNWSISENLPQSVTHVRTDVLSRDEVYDNEAAEILKSIGLNADEFIESTFYVGYCYGEEVACDYIDIWFGKEEEQIYLLTFAGWSAFQYLETEETEGNSLVLEQKNKMLKSVKIDEEHFPDEEFRAYVKSHFDANGNSILSVRELEKVYQIDVYYEELISDLTGIEYFTNLASLNCVLTGITKLDVSNNPQLEDLSCGSTRITELDVSNNPQLETLYCYNTGIIELDVSNNPQLEYLDCYTTGIIELDVSNNPQLEVLSCTSTGITELDVSNNPQLEVLYCAGTGITELDVSNNPQLEDLSCAATGITELDVSNNPQLKYLYCKETGITELDVSNNSQLEVLYCGATGITELDVSNNPQLEELSCKETGITELDVSNNPQLEDLYCYNTGITELDISNIVSKLYDLSIDDRADLTVYYNSASDSYDISYLKETYPSVQWIG